MNKNHFIEFIFQPFLSYFRRYAAYRKSWGCLDNLPYCRRYAASKKGKAGSHIIYHTSSAMRLRNRVTSASMVERPNNAAAITLPENQVAGQYDKMEKLFYTQPRYRVAGTVW